MIWDNINYSGGAFYWSKNCWNIFWQHDFQLKILGIRLGNSRDGVGMFTNLGWTWEISPDLMFANTVTYGEPIVSACRNKQMYSLEIC